eukprot:Gb_19007 [translate_table: standard]
MADRNMGGHYNNEPQDDEGIGCSTPQLQKITVRHIHTQFVETTQDKFKSVVQTLTGHHSTATTHRRRDSGTEAKIKSPAGSFIEIPHLRHSVDPKAVPGLDQCSVKEEDDEKVMPSNDDIELIAERFFGIEPEMDVYSMSIDTTPNYFDCSYEDVVTPLDDYVHLHMITDSLWLFDDAHYKQS